MRMIPVAPVSVSLVVVLALMLALSGCASLPFANPFAPAETVTTAPASVPQQAASPAALRPPPATARTAQAFDTTSPAQRAAAVAAAVAAPPAARAALTTVSLGDPAAPGLWLETPLVSQATTARVTVPATGKAAALDLRPISGPVTAGSRMSLAAMRLLGLPLTALTEVAVDLP